MEPRKDGVIPLRRSSRHAGAARSGGRRIARRPIASPRQFSVGLWLARRAIPLRRSLTGVAPPRLRAFAVCQLRVLRVLRVFRGWGS